MPLLLLFAAALIGTGLFLIASDLFRIPSMKSSKTFKSLSKRQRRKVSSVNVFAQDLANWLSKYIRMNEFKRNKLASDLKSAGEDITPELHIAEAIVGAFPLAFLIFPAFYIFPLSVPLVIGGMVTIYYRGSKAIQTKIKTKRDIINFELPRLVATIERTLEHSRDVLTMLENYKKIAVPELRDELDITVADMRSGNYENALVALSSRVGSPMLADVTSGLIMIMRGDESLSYWSNLSQTLATQQRELLKQQALKKPEMVKRLTFGLLLTLVGIYLAVIAVEIVSNIDAF